MKKKTLRYLFCVTVFIFTLCCVKPVFAHGGEPRLEISAERLSHGDTLQLRGVDFESEEEVAVVLVDSTSHVLIISLGTIVADAEGGFTQNVVFPADLPENVYAIRATTYDHVIFSPAFTVWGTAIEDQESNVIVDQSDVQFGPVPTFAATVIPKDTLSQQPTVQPSQPSSQSAIETGGISTLPLVMVLLGAGILVVLGARKMIQRK